jgi:galactose mutarotase-like enzyme
MAELHCGALAATWLPEHGMVGASLRHDGRELLGQRGGLTAYLARGSAFGIPLLAPWANRLDGLRYGQVELDPAAVKLDANGLPKDGVMAGRAWETVSATDSRLVAAFASDPAVLRAFPFPHRYRVTVELTEQTLSVTTELSATGVVAVPVAFGWHPLFTLPGVAREDYEIVVPGVRESVLDARGIPTGATQLPSGDLADTEFREIAGDFVLRGGGQTIAVSFGAPSYPVGHVWSPPGEPFIAWEPMTAPTNALVSGDGLRHVAPGATFAATFSVSYSAD